MCKNYTREYELKNGQFVVIRNLKSQDAEAMICFMQTVDAESRFLSREPGEFCFSVEQERDIIAKSLKNEHTHWVVADLNGELTGVCEVSRVSAKQRFCHRAAIALVVLKQYWGLGIGTIFMNDAIAWGKEKGYEQLELGVVKGNEKALALYQRLGFVITGETRNALKYRDGTYADESIMWLDLQV